MKAPTVGVAFDGTGVGLAVEVGVDTGVSLGEGEFDTDGFGEVLAGVGFEPGFAVDCPVEPAEVPAVAAADATALTAAEPAGAEPATPVEDTAALGSVLDAAAGVEDVAALFLCDELEQPDSVSAKATVTPSKPVARIRAVMAFPPAGMRQE